MRKSRFGTLKHRPRRPQVYWIYVYEHANGTGGYNFETTRDYAKVAGICVDFKEEKNRDGTPAWRKCEVLGGDANGPSGDFDSFAGGWVR